MVPLNIELPSILKKFKELFDITPLPDLWTLPKNESINSNGYKFMFEK